jgi:two-component system CheB/CheR fusion protein
VNDCGGKGDLAGVGLGWARKRRADSADEAPGRLTAEKRARAAKPRGTVLSCPSCARHPEISPTEILKTKPIQAPELKPTKKPSESPVTEPAPAPPPSDKFPIVGLGASAGGLEALELFLKNVPPTSGLAFVIVQHLDPVHKGIMAELLQRCTPMKVVQVKDRTKVRPDCVYVIPPNRDMSILHGVLHLLEPAAPRGLRLPIDFFLRSLAEDQRERSVGIILSGMGSDGTIGLRAIKEHAGVVLVQEPTSAKFEGMPSSAIDAGLADIVAPVEELPGKLLQYLHQTPLLAHTDAEPERGADSQLEKVILLLRNHTGHDFSLYKSNTLYRRIERRMGLHQIPKIATYVRYLRENPQEAELLFKELLIGVTNFFRDPVVWEQFRDEALPTLLTSRAAGRSLRAWVVGCSTGEEAYSLAITFKEAVEKMESGRSYALQIFATDLDREAIDKARQGHYPANIAADLSPQRLSRFFTKEESGYRVSKEIREMVIFAPQNLIMDPPFTKMDILICRNLLIYFTAELQKKLLPLFHYALNPGGVLLLGSAESTGGFRNLFTPLPGKSRLFRRKDSGQRAELEHFPTAYVASRLDPRAEPSAPPLSPDSLQALAEQWLLKHHAPTAILATGEGDILFISGRTGRFLEPVAGKANWNIFVMAREGLRHELTSAFLRARRQKEAVLERGLKVRVEGAQRFVNLSVQILDEPGALRGLVMVVFTESAGPLAAPHERSSKPVRSSQRLRDLERDLQQAREDAQSTREEMQSSQEELKSMNEELQTVNAELQSKVDELSTASNDMKNLLNSTEIATVFLDNELHVRRFTEQATRIIKLIPGDVGRPITDLSTVLIYPGLAEDAREVLRTLLSVEKPIASRDRRWFAMRMMPYRTMDNRIDGVVITFTDMSLARKLEAALAPTDSLPP